ncbi:MAG: CHRD domain-containing protein [Terriglobia bacterium]
MKTFRFLALLLAGLVLAGVSARADFIAQAHLAGDGESNSSGTGFGTVTFNSASGTLAVSLSFSGLTSGTQAVDSLGASHIHFGAPGVEGPVLFPFATFPTGVTSGNFSTTLTAADLLPDAANGINTFAEAAAAIQAGDTYFNIHTVNFPGGEIRGQISTVPESSTLLMVLLGLGAMGLYLRKRNTVGAKSCACANRAS